MRYKLLGRSGLRVSELALGAMTFGTEWGWGSERAEAKGVFDAFAEAGGNFIDTANIYNDGGAERLLGEFIASDREHFVVATKYSGAVGMYSATAGAPETRAVKRSTSEGDILRSGNSRRNMMRSVEDSLRRLKTDYIDLFYLHFWDNTTAIDEIMRGLDDLVSAGKVMYVAFSDTPAWITAQASLLADLRGWAPLTAIQVEYSLIERTPERELLPMAKAMDLAVVPWSPLAGGILAGKYARTASHRDRASSEEGTEQRRLDADALPERQMRIALEVARIADELGVSSARVALAWVRQQARRWGVVIPLIGARTRQQLADNLGCLEVELNDAVLGALDDASAVDLGFPHTMIESDLIRALKTSGKHDLLDNHHK
ncbi:MAG TPA: aldo/keto reductase [Candidatus Dormibacteraeota bacterium]|nr:aldo/keto reductase [Candidatus Dormibacteraeota bacterium]